MRISVILVLLGCLLATGCANTGLLMQKEAFQAEAEAARDAVNAMRKLQIVERGHLQEKLRDERFKKSELKVALIDAAEMGAKSEEVLRLRSDLARSESKSSIWEIELVNQGKAADQRLLELQTSAARENAKLKEAHNAVMVDQAKNAGQLVRGLGNGLLGGAETGAKVAGGGVGAMLLAWALSRMKGGMV